jgi:FixJ family two-component response regulator
MRRCERAAAELLKLPVWGEHVEAELPNAPLVSIVEDDNFLRASMRRLIRSLGLTVEAFPSAAGLLASPRLAETNCLITDVNMPAMTGIELYRHLVKTGCAIPTILITAYPNDLDRTAALNEGVICYLQKPIDQQDLVRCLHAALSSDKPPFPNL